MQNRLQCDNCVRRILRQEQRSIPQKGTHRRGQPRGHFHTPGHQERGQQYILCTPYGPVAHRLIVMSHPPEMCGQIRQQDPALQVVLDAGQIKRADSIEFFFQQISRTGKQSPVSQANRSMTGLVTSGRINCGVSRIYRSYAREAARQSLHRWNRYH